MGKAYKFLEFYVSHLPASTNEWRTLLDRANDICRKYENKLMTDIMMAIVDEIERLYKNEKADK